MPKAKEIAMSDSEVQAHINKRKNPTPHEIKVGKKGGKKAFGMANNDPLKEYEEKLAKIAAQSKRDAAAAERAYKTKVKPAKAAPMDIVVLSAEYNAGYAAAVVDIRQAISRISSKQKSC
mgnify:CR=1 FL=1